MFLEVDKSKNWEVREYSSLRVLTDNNYGQSEHRVQKKKARLTDNRIHLDFDVMETKHREEKQIRQIDYIIDLVT